MRKQQLTILAAALASGLAAAPLFALPCTTQSQMQPADRQSYSAAALDFATLAQLGNAAQLRSRLLPAVANSFDSISTAVLAAAPQLKASQPQVHSIYLLDATTLAPGTDGIFDCTLNNSPLEVIFSLAQLNPGSYLVALLRFEDSGPPLQMLLILTKTSPTQKDWQLGGLFLRPLTLAGHDGLWYWQQARSFATAKQNWSAQLYFAAAAQLLVPVPIFTSPNLEKLEHETNAARAKDYPLINADTVDAAPAEIHPGSQSWALHQAKLIEPSAGTLPDLLLEYSAAKIAAPAEARADCIALAKALLAAHPEIRPLFQGMRIRAVTKSGDQFAIALTSGELP